MIFKVHITTTLHCSLERAFKTPMLCDVTKVHTGYGLMPKITAVSEDANWGKKGGTKKVYAARSISFKGGYVSIDTVIDRIDNAYWKIEVSDFQSWMLGFTHFTGEWRVKELAPEVIHVDYTYTLHAGATVLYPFQWLFAQLFWKKYMHHVTENIRRLIEQQEPYMYD